MNKMKRMGREGKGRDRNGRGCKGVDKERMKRKGRERKVMDE